MAVGLLARAQAAADGIFIQRVLEAAWEAALAIYSEVSTTPGHVARATYAVAVLTDTTGQHGTIFAHACVAQGVDGSSTDAQIAVAVAACWNALAHA